ncbi:hypothetical protein ACQKWADRAFT_292957 [Trichoderma austrokoningii]
MRLKPRQDTGAATPKSGRRKLRPGEPSEWPDDAASPPHARGSVQIQRRLDPTQPPLQPQLVTRRREYTSSKAADASVSATSAAVAAGGRSNVAPWQPGLARLTSETYRRPGGMLHIDSYDGEDESANEQQQPPRRRRRHSSPSRPLMPGAYSEASTHRSPSVSSYGGDRDDGIEVEEVPPDDAAAPSHDDYLDSSIDRDRFRRRFTPRQHYSYDGHDSDSAPSDNEAASSPATRESSRVRARSETRHSAPRYQLTHVNGASRPLGLRSVISLNGSTSGPDNYFQLERQILSDQQKGVACVICMEETSPSKGADLKCGHRMCNACMKRNFEMSLRDPQHMPPRCCTKAHIPLKHVDQLFDDAFKRAWNRKYAEYSTGNRVYCPSKRCGEWIKPTNFYRGEDGRMFAQCGRCDTKVCPECNSKWHSSLECPRDEETNKLLDQAKEEGWMRCYKCKSLVELKEGCNHMTCRCGAQFCMLCGQKWKSCSCPWFNHASNIWERNLMGTLPRPFRRRNRSNSMENLQTPSTSIPIRPRPQNVDPNFDSRRTLMDNVIRSIQSHEFDEFVQNYRHKHQHHDEREEEDRDRHRNRKRDRHRKHDRDRKRGNRERPRDREPENPFAPMFAPSTFDVEENEKGYRSVPSQWQHLAADYRRTSMPALSTTIPMSMAQPQQQQQQPFAGYVPDANRVRGPQRGDSLERRLADRLSEDRSGRKSTGPSPPAPVMRPHVIHQRDVAADVEIGMAMGAMGRGAMPPPPPPPYAPPTSHYPPLRTPWSGPLVGDMAYHDTAYTYTAPKSVQDPYYYGGMDATAQPELPDSRRRSRRSGEERERPKSSTMAGLTGYGRGAHRVSEWASFVEPEYPNETE